MKLNSNRFCKVSIYLAMIAIFMLFLAGSSNSISVSNSEVEENFFTENAMEEAAFEKIKKHKKRNLAKTRKGPSPAGATAPPSTNTTLTGSVYKDLNESYIKQEVNVFKDNNRKWDYKLLDKQLEDIFKTMNLKQNKDRTMFGDRAYIEIFLNAFDQCDKNHDMTLDLNEFQGCMKNDTYLKRVTPPPAVYAASPNYTDPTYFYTQIFNLLDVYNAGSVNFHAYMELRLMIFSWRKCSVSGPFIEETSWECAIEIVAGYKTSSRTTLRNTFYMCLELANAQNIRNIDFISFMMFASGARLYGRINGKEDHDVTKNEFNLVLDENMLPSRYNQFIVNTFFELTKEDDHESQGIDFQTFIYYDFVLRIYEVKNATRRWQLNQAEFSKVLTNPLFPLNCTQEIQMIPMTNFTNSSYQMYTYLNISQFHDESDYLLKFVEKSGSNLKKSKLQTRTRTQSKAHQIYNLASNVSFFLNFTASRIFQVIDVNSDGFIDWYDFGHFFQTLYLFGKFDPYAKGRITAGDVYEKYIDYSDFPRVSSTLRHRARRFNLLNQDTYVDVFSVLVILRIDDIVSLYTRKTDKSTLYEVELKRIFAKANLRYLSDGLLNRCLRGMDIQNVPKYDWECAFMAGVQENINYIESAASYNTAKYNNLTLVNTVFYNVDPALNAAAGAAKPKFM